MIRVILALSLALIFAISLLPHAAARFAPTRCLFPHCPTERTPSTGRQRTPTRRATKD